MMLFTGWRWQTTRLCTSCELILNTSTAPLATPSTPSLLSGQPVSSTKWLHLGHILERHVCRSQDVCVVCTDVNTTWKCGNYCFIATCSLALRSNSLELAHIRWHLLARMLAVGSHLLELTKINSHLPALLELAHNLSHSLARPLAGTISHSLELTHTLALAGAHYNRLARTRSHAC